eukprot:SAG22_NODE_2023_length_3123_cov_12.161045_2_plen_353_part_00
MPEQQTAVKKRRRAPAASAARSQARANSKVARLGSSRADEGPPPPPWATSTAAASVGNANGARKRSFQPSLDPKVPPHTLILGTQPSDNSLGAGKYYMTNDNAFWHIVGDGLGFRRGFFVGQRTDAPPSIAPHLLHPPASALGYEDAMRRLTGSGYAVWDIIESSVRKGSLDSNIRAAVYADVRGLVARHPTIRKICFATGSNSAAMFRKAPANKAWLAERPPAFEVAPGDALSQKVFGKVVRTAATASAASAPPRGGGGGGGGIIRLVVMESVSPAYVPRQSWEAQKQRDKGFDDEYATEPVAKYKWKRDQWLRDCFAATPVPVAGARELETAAVKVEAGREARVKSEPHD